MTSALKQVWKLVLRRGGGVAALVLLLATFADAQTSQFLFDGNGNLTVQMAETIFQPQTIGQPPNQIVAPGETASFFIVARGSLPLTYQWRFNNANIGGATGDTLLLQNVSTNHEGEYRVVLANPSGSVTSAPAMLWIDSDADGVSDSGELTHFGSLTNSASADFDGDGSPNLQEFLEGTNPTSTNSVLFHLTVVRDGGSVAILPEQSSYTNGASVTLTAIASPGEEHFHAWTGDILTRSNPVTLVMTNNLTVYARFTPINFFWTNLAGGDWDSATNWTPHLAPGSNDSVVIPLVATVTLNTAADCADVTLGNGVSGPALTGSGTLTVRGNFSWTAGNMSGSGRTVIEPSATLNVSGGVTLNTRTLENGGTGLWSGNGSLNMSTSAVITNGAGALFHIQNAAPLGTFLGGRFDNAGLFRKSSNVGTTTIPVNFNNYGTVEIQSGTLLCQGIVTNNGAVTLAAGTTNRLTGGGSGSGTFSASATAMVEWTSGTFTLTAGAQLNGDGLYRINFGSVSVNPDLTLANLDLVAGSLSGPGTVRIGNSMNWTGGAMIGSGRTIIPAGVTLNAAIPSGATLSSRTLENGGTVLWTGSGSISLSTAVITNRAGGLFHAQNAAAFVFGGGGCRFDNAGTFRKSISTGPTTVRSGMSFNNYGTVDIRSGILAANGGYTSTSNALLNLAVGGTTAGTNHGQLKIAGAVTLNGALSVDLLPGFTPATNDTFTILTAGTRNGTFTSFLYPSNAVTMQLSNTANAVTIRVSGLAVPELVLLPPVLTSSNVTLCWIIAPNKNYRLEYAADPGLTNWSAVPGEGITSGDRSCVIDVLTSSNRFYRIREVP